jgi:hypothetical protein
MPSSRRLAAAGHDPISEATGIRKILNSIERTGQFEDPVLDWRKTPVDDQSWGNFKVHFKAADVERKRKVTAKSGGYRSANLATTADLKTRIRADIHAEYAASAAASAALSATQAPLAQIAQRTRTKACHITTNWSYCWTHGLSRDSTHNSNSCPRQRDGHETTANVENMLGGNPIISRNLGEKVNNQFMFTCNNRTGRKPLK